MRLEFRLSHKSSIAKRPQATSSFNLLRRLLSSPRRMWESPPGLCVQLQAELKHRTTNRGLGWASDITAVATEKPRGAPASASACRPPAWAPGPFREARPSPGTDRGARASEPAPAPRAAGGGRGLRDERGRHSPRVDSSRGLPTGGKRL